MDPKKPIVHRRVWRMTANTPLGEFLDLIPKAAVYPATPVAAKRTFHSEKTADTERTVHLEKTAPPKRIFHPEKVVPSNRTLFMETSLPRETTGEPAIEAAAKVLTPAKVPSWRASSYDLLTGLTVNDVTDTIPGDILDELFNP